MYYVNTMILTLKYEIVSFFEKITTSLVFL